MSFERLMAIGYPASKQWCNIYNGGSLCDCGYYRPHTLQSGAHSGSYRRIAQIPYPSTKSTTTTVTADHIKA